MDKDVMNQNKNRLFKLCLFLLVALPVFAQTAYVRTTTNTDPWVDSGAHAAAVWAKTANYIEVFPDTQYQTMLGFGGCFQERMWDALRYCSAAGRDSVIEALFDTSGCNFNWGRVPIGCCDFDNNSAPLSLDDSCGDYQMKYFSLSRDSLKRIPLIKMAQAYQPNMRFWACPWSPPAWMKSNNSFLGGNMKSDSATLAAYALYLEKFVKGYQACGINIESITCQNQPDQAVDSYPECGWSNALEKTFYKNHMIPRFKQDGVGARILLGVYISNSYSNWITYFMQDSAIANFVNFTSHAFESNTWGAQAYADYPTIPFMQTESNWKGDPDWATGVSQFNDLAKFTSTGRASVFTEWNMVNNQTSKSCWGWAQCIMINIDTTNGKVTYNPYFYAAKHFGHYVKVHAKAIKFIVNGLTKLTGAAFRNPDGDIILNVGNANSCATSVITKIGNRMVEVTMPANSFNTLRIVGPTAVREMGLQTRSAPTLGAARIRGSILHFTVPASLGAQEINLTLTDLQGRIIWTGRIGGAKIRGEQQAVAIRSSHGGLHSGTYILNVKIKNEASAVTMLEQKVSAVN
jgi:glucosylceramidase